MMRRALHRRAGTRAFLHWKGPVFSCAASEAITAPAELVSQWNDISGNARHLLQGTGANQPILIPHTGTNYLWLPAVTGNYASTPDSPANSVTGDLECTIRLALADYTPTAAKAVMAKWNTVGNQRSFTFFQQVTSGNLSLSTSSDGIALTKTFSVGNPGFVDGQTYWWRFRFRSNDGGVATCEFFQSTDGVTFSLIGTKQLHSAPITLHNSTSAVEVGSDSAGTNSPSGKVYYAEVRNGISGTIVARFDPAAATSLTSVPNVEGQTAWTINSTGSKPAQIADSNQLLFDGTAHYLKAVGFTLNQPETVYLLIKPITWTSGDYISDGNAANSGALTDTTGTPQINLNAGSSVAGNVNATLGNWHVISAIYNGASSSLQVRFTTATTGNAGAANMGGFTLGASGGNANFGNFQCKAAMIFNVAHDAATRARAITQMARIGGVTL